MTKVTEVENSLVVAKGSGMVGGRLHKMEGYKKGDRREPGGGEFLNLHGKKLHRVKYTEMSTWVSQKI